MQLYKDSASFRRSRADSFEIVSNHQTYITVHEYANFSLIVYCNCLLKWGIYVSIMYHLLSINRMMVTRQATATYVTQFLTGFNIVMTPVNRYSHLTPFPLQINLFLSTGGERGGEVRASGEFYVGCVHTSGRPSSQ